MLFNSIEFLLFLPAVFVVYWLLQNNRKLQNAFLLLASYFFYGLWDYRFLSLIILSSAIDYTVGLSMSKTEDSKKRKRLLSVSLLFNIGMLLVFKYFNFFIDSFASFSGLFGLEANLPVLNVILPVGISFYTFQTLSYTIDIYRKKLEPSSSALNFFTYVAFFPQLVAGPIERASNLLPQIEGDRQFSYLQGISGLRQILWGLFKKVVIADNCSPFVDTIFNGSANFGPLILILGAVLFAFQIYCDFSGYSDIAIGTARLLGFKLMQNFATPYFSRDIAEFWRRWHISLSTWFRDYVYIPLGGSRVGQLFQLRNVFVIFIVSGFWHGANWTFIIWGIIHALFYIPQIFTGTNRQYTNSISDGGLLPSLADVWRIFRTFVITTIAWVFFRAESLKASMAYFAGMINPVDISFDRQLHKLRLDPSDILIIASSISLMMLVEWVNRDKIHCLARVPKNPIFRFAFYLLLVVLVLEFFYGEASFIYFQF